MQHPRIDLFWDGAGDGGGGDTGTGSANDAAGSDGADDGSGAGGNDQKTPELPTTVEEWQEYHTKLTESHETALKTLNDKISQQTASIDKQGNRIEQFETLKKAMKLNPAAIAKEMFANSGKEIVIKDVATGPENKTMKGIIAQIHAGEGDVEDLTNQLTNQIATLSQNASQQAILPTLNNINESNMASKYKDWDALSEDRAHLKNQLAGHQLHSDELVHLAVIGSKMGDVIKGAKAEGYAQAERDLTKKYKMSLSGAGGFKKQEKEKADNKKVLNNALKVMRSN